MKFKFIRNQKLMNSIFLILIPLIIPSNTVINALLVSLSLIVVHILSNASITAINSKLENKPYRIPVILGVCVAIPVVLGLVFGLIFNDYSSVIVELSCFVAIGEMLLCVLVDSKYDNFKENIISCLPSAAIIAVILLLIGFLREIIGLSSLLGFALPVGNLKPIGLFNQTEGGLLLLGILVVLYSILIRNNEEEK